MYIVYLYSFQLINSKSIVFLADADAPPREQSEVPGHQRLQGQAGDGGVRPQRGAAEVEVRHLPRGQGQGSRHGERDLSGQGNMSLRERIA